MPVSIATNSLSNSADDQLDYELSVVDGEHDVLAMWRSNNVPEIVHRSTIGKKQFQVYDGPPFATGLPHYGHILVSYVKDCVMRYKRQSGYCVDPRFGWDCHGLPIEFEIDKLLNIKTPADVEKIGIKKYNEECSAIVSRFSKQWEEIMSRIGRWADFRNDWKTMYPSYMESVWAVFKMIFDKGLVYKGFRVMPFSTGCTTPLSNFEANLNYKSVNDPSIIAIFPIEGNESTKFLAWTTTPWTLPSNLSLCVHPDMDYIKIQSLMEGDTESFYIFAKSRLAFVKKSIKKYEIVEEMKGIKLAGIKYMPLFNFYDHLKARKAAFTVLCDSYVSDDSGTGVVQQSPFFGVDDYRTALENGLFVKGESLACPIDEVGKFTADVPTYQGQYIKDADKLITKDLKERKRLLSVSSEKHNYPFCWRSNTPLVYRAVSSWFINVESIVDNLVKANQEVNWVPKSIKDGRFGQWLENAQDWLFSRNRYWGCPIPIWVSDDFEEIVCVGSIAELKELSGVAVNDLHRDSIDHITIDSKFGKGKLKRIPEVFDCWFESGCAPYASHHFPFETAKTFDHIFPAKFISEGIDQCRGWFYTLTVIATALFNRAPFENVVTLGLLMAEDGQKMSKSKKNYPDPQLLLEKYGSDAVRMYLMSSPAVHGDSINFRQQEVEEYLKKVVLQIYNSAKFFKTGIDSFNMSNSDQKYAFDPSNFEPSDHVIDKWIISLTNSTIKTFHAEMDKFHIYKIIPKIPQFMNNLNNWYIKLCRSRLKGLEKSEKSTKSQQDSLDTLCYVLLTVTSLFAPFLPFMTERIYQTLKPHIKMHDLKLTVHLTPMPECNENLIDLKIEKVIADVQSVINLIRSARDKCGIAIKNPLKEATVFCQSVDDIKNLQSMQDLIIYDSNVKNLTFVDKIQDNKFGIELVAAANHRQLAGRLKKNFKQVLSALDSISQSDLFLYKSGETITVCGHEILQGDLSLSYVIKNNKTANYEFQYNDNFLLILFTEIDDDLKNEAAMRYLVSSIQKTRKAMKLIVSDTITISYIPNIQDVSEIISKYGTQIEQIVNGNFQLCDILNGDVEKFMLNDQLMMTYSVKLC